MLSCSQNSTACVPVHPLPIRPSGLMDPLPPVVRLVNVRLGEEGEEARAEKDKDQREPVAGLGVALVDVAYKGFNSF